MDIQDSRLSGSSQSSSKYTEVRPPHGSSRDCHLRASSSLTMTGWQESSHLVTYHPSQQILTACLGVGHQEIKWRLFAILAFYSLLWNQINTCMYTAHIKPYTCTAGTAHNSGKVPLSGRTTGSAPSCDSFPASKGLQAAQCTAWQASAGTNFLSDGWEEAGQERQEAESVQLEEEQRAWHTVIAPAGAG